MTTPPPGSTLTATLFSYTTLLRSHGLRYAVVERARDEGLKGCEDIYAQDSRPGAILRELALRYHAFATAPRSLALMRLVIAQSLTDPEFGRRFNQDRKSTRLNSSH